MAKLTVQAIERKLKTAHDKRNRSRPEDSQAKSPNNALSLRWYPKLKLFKGANVSFDPFKLTADSYDWWQFVCLIRGKLVFNSHRYSMTTIKHQYSVRDLLRELGLKIHAEVDMRESLTPESFKESALANLYYLMIQLEIERSRKGSNKKANTWRIKRIKELQRDIKTIRALGAKFSKADEKSLRAELMADETRRLERLRAERESSKDLRTEIKAVEKSLLSANQYAVI